MITRIILENYMSHARTVIEPAAGLTVLVGPNNCGKSAVVSALRTLCDNPLGDYMVRHGATECCVTVETNDGGEHHTFAWKRKKDVVSYLIDGRPIHRLKGNLPEDLHQHLRMPKVHAEDGNDFDIHFGLQKEPIFLLSESARRAAQFFASSSDAEKLLEMQRRHGERVKNAKSKVAELTVEIEQLDRMLAALAPAPELAAKADALSQEHSELSQAQQNAMALEQSLGNQKRHVARRGFFHRVAETVRPLSPAPALADTSDVERLSREISAAHGRRRRISSIGGALEHLQSPPAVQDVSPLADLIARQRRAQSDVDIRRAALSAADAELTASRSQLRAWAVENPICPVCGGSIDSDRLLSHGHN
jgi:DNA repair exonuclease SbcCD ATPase subunit